MRFQEEAYCDVPGFLLNPCPPSASACKKNYLQGMATIAQRFFLFNVLLPPGTETVTLPIASLQLPFAFSSCLLTVTFQTPWYSCLGDDKGWGLCSACDADRRKCERIHPTAWAKPPYAWLPVLGERMPWHRVPSPEPLASHSRQPLPGKCVWDCTTVGLCTGMACYYKGRGL